MDWLSTMFGLSPAMAAPALDPSWAQLMGSASAAPYEPGTPTTTFPTGNAFGIGMGEAANPSPSGPMMAGGGIGSDAMFPTLGAALAPMSADTFVGPMPPGASGGAPAPGMPLDITPPGAGAEAATASAQGAGANPLTQALRGVQAPKPPDVVKPATPPPPAIRPIQQGALMELLAAMGAYGGSRGGASSVQKYPATLGQALGGR